MSPYAPEVNLSSIFKIMFVVASLNVLLAVRQGFTARSLTNGYNATGASKNCALPRFNSLPRDAGNRN